MPKHEIDRRTAARLLSLLPFASTAGAASKQGRTPARSARRKPVTIAQALVAFKDSPFPFQGTIPGDDKPFLEQNEDGRRFHLSPRGGKLYLDTTYSDRRSLIYASRWFDPWRSDAVLVLFFHGNQAILLRDVAARQGVPRQLAASRLNAVLVAPQMAVDALDSTAGRFYERGFLDAYLAEAAAHVAQLSGGRASAAAIERLPVVVVAYSGGYVPAIYVLQQDQARHRRVIGAVLLDALFGEEDKYADWIAQTRATSFFVSAYSASSARHNVDLRNALEAKGIEIASGLPDRIGKGTVAFRAAPEAVHKDFVTEAWVTEPLAFILKRVGLGRERRG